MCSSGYEIQIQIKKKNPKDLCFPWAYGPNYQDSV
jgi:hypothetical protein